MTDSLPSERCPVIGCDGGKLCPYHSNSASYELNLGHDPTPSVGASEPAKEKSENEQNRGLDCAVDDNRAGQQSDHARLTIAHSRGGGIFAKDAAKWLRERWPHRPMTTGGLPDECLEQHLQPTRKKIERWLVEYAEDALPIRHERVAETSAERRVSVTHWCKICGYPMDGSECSAKEIHPLVLRDLVPVGAATGETAEQWLDTELWNFVHGTALDLGLVQGKESNVAEAQLHRDTKTACLIFARQLIAERDAAANLLTNVAQILDVVKREWADSWSKWDQEQRDGITKWLVQYHAELASLRSQMEKRK